MIGLFLISNQNSGIKYKIFSYFMMRSGQTYKTTLQKKLTTVKQMTICLIEQEMLIIKKSWNILFVQLKKRETPTDIYFIDDGVCTRTE